MKKQTKLFSFWKDNKTDGLFQLTKYELIEKFQAWLPTKKPEWIEHYDTRNCVGVFVGEKEGLNSVGNDENKYAEYDEMAEILKPIRRKYLESVISTKE
jgi:hypothetical protein